MACVKDGRSCGWGVAIVTAAFVLSFIRDGIRLSFGMFFVVFTDTFQKDAATTAWIGSIMAAALNFSAPVASIIVSKFGSRCSTVVGGVLCFLGFITSAYVPNLYFLYFSLGIMTGFGLGLSYLAQTVIVVKYFKANRSLAIAAAVCGSGIGGVFFSFLMDALTHEYSWSGIMLILSGVMLQACVAGTLMKPKQQNNGPEKYLDQKAIDSLDTSHHLDDSDTGRCRQDAVMLQLDDSRAFEQDEGNIQDAYSTVSLDSTPVQKQNAYSNNYNTVAAESPTNTHNEDMLSAHTETHEHHSDINITQDAIENTNTLCEKDTVLDETINDAGLEHLDTVTMNDCPSSSPTAATPLVAPTAATALVARRLDDPSAAARQGSGRLGAVYGPLLRDSKLYMFVLSQFVLSGGYMLPFTFVPTTALASGFSQTEAAWLLTASSITSIVTRLPIGVLGDRKFVNRSYLYTAILALLGLTCLALAFATSYAGLVVVCCCYGAGTGAIVVLIPVVITDIFGDSRISEVFGLTMFGRGPGGLFILPLAGYILDRTGSTRAVYILAACAYGGATLVNAACVYKHRRQLAAAQKHD